MTGVSSDTSHNGTQQERRHQLVNCNAANAASKHMTQDAHLKIVFETRSSKNQTQHEIGCKYIHTMVNGGQITVSHIAGVRRELHDQFIAAHNGKPPWSRKAFVRTFRGIDEHDVVSSGIFVYEFHVQHPRE